MNRLQRWLRRFPIGTPVSEPETTSYDPRLEHPLTHRYDPSEAKFPAILIGGLNNGLEIKVSGKPWLPARPVDVVKIAGDPGQYVRGGQQATGQWRFFYEPPGSGS